MPLRTIAASHRAASCLIVGVLAACYTPSLPEGAPCANTSRCPVDQACIGGYCQLASAGPMGPDGGGTDAPSAVGCSSDQQCATARLIGTLSGDTGVALTMTSGSRSAWLRVRVVENDDTVAGHPLRVQALLRSTGSARFDVRLYVNPGADVLACATPSALPVTDDDISAAMVSWGETDLVANGTDDSRDVVIEIRAVSGTCLPGGTWELTLSGGSESSSS